MGGQTLRGTPARRFWWSHLVTRSCCAGSSQRVLLGFATFGCCVLCEFCACCVCSVSLWVSGTCASSPLRSCNLRSPSSGRSPSWSSCSSSSPLSSFKVSRSISRLPPRRPHRQRPPWSFWFHAHGPPDPVHEHLGRHQLVGGGVSFVGGVHCLHFYVRVVHHGDDFCDFQHHHWNLCERCIGGGELGQGHRPATREGTHGPGAERAQRTFRFG